MLDSREVPEASKWLTQYLNKADTGKSKKPPATFLLVRAGASSSNNESAASPEPVGAPGEGGRISGGWRALSRYMGPTQAPFSEDMDAQRAGAASPFRMWRVPVAANDAIKFHDVAPLHVGSLASLEALRTAIAESQGAQEQQQEQQGQ